MDHFKVEQEEEYLTNTLQKKLTQVCCNLLDFHSDLNQLKNEKIELENQLEQEQEYIVNKLQKQLSQIQDEKRFAFCTRSFIYTQHILGR